jgi:hypothetical protein
VANSGLRDIKAIARSANVLFLIEDEKDLKEVEVD